MPDQPTSMHPETPAPRYVALERVYAQVKAADPDKPKALDFLQGLEHPELALLVELWHTHPSFPHRRALKHQALLALREIAHDEMILRAYIEARKGPRPGRRVPISHCEAQARAARLRTALLALVESQGSLMVGRTHDGAGRVCL